MAVAVVQKARDFFNNSSLLSGRKISLLGCRFFETCTSYWCGYNETPTAKSSKLKGRWKMTKRRTANSTGTGPTTGTSNSTVIANWKRAAKKKTIEAVALVTMVALVAVFSQVAARADLTDSSPSGFTIKVTVTIHATPAEVYRKLIDIGSWWESAHTFSHDAHNLSIEEKPMGCFCEKLPNGGFVRHMEIIYAEPGKILRMSGPIGPLQAFAVTGIATFTLAPAPEGTILQLTYPIGGYAPQGLTGIAPVADMVLTTQINRLKRFVETGNPASTEKK